MPGHAETLSRATPSCGSPMLNPTRCEYCLPWKEAPQLRHTPTATSPGSWILAPSSSSMYSLYSLYSLNSLYSLFFLAPAPSTTLLR